MAAEPRVPAAGRSLRARLGRAFFLQAGFIGAAAVVSVFVAGALLEGLLIREALREEAAHYWRLRDQRPEFQLPNTQNLTGYLAPDVPPALAAFRPGFHDWEDGDSTFVVYVIDRDAERLYLVFNRGAVTRLATLYGLAPLAGVLLVLYLSTWLGFRASRRAISPVIALARRVRELKPGSPDAEAFQEGDFAQDADDEVRELSEALARYASRLREFIERERQFTRDASHELRSPLTVIGMAAEMLLASDSLDDAARRAAQRIQRAVRDMEELTQAFLLLARESETGLPNEVLCVNQVAAAEMERASVLADGRPIRAEFTETERLFVTAPEKVLSVLLGNLLRNAFSYTDAGSVTVSVDHEGVWIRDTGIGMQPEQVARMYHPFVRGDHRRGGHGVGLTIVRRLSDRFGWPVNIETQPGVGTQVRIRFPDARREPVPAAP